MQQVICEKCGRASISNARYCSSCGYELPRLNIPAAPIIEPVEKKGGFKKIIPVIAGVVMFYLAYYGIQHMFFSPPTFDKAMMQIASEVNKTCPIMVDNETRLDNTIALPGNIFQYNYTLVNMDKSSVDTIAAKNYLEPNVVNMVKTNPQMELVRKNKVIVNYLYRDKKMEYLFMISVTPDKYENN